MENEMSATAIEIWKIKDKGLRTALYAADSCKRTPVTAKFLWEHPDAQGYIFDIESEEMGLDPWKTVEGVYESADKSSIILETGSTFERPVPPDFIVYVPANYSHFTQGS